ncbi:helix-turn-helix domain-containing protein (plasmid) [Rhodococcoides fascians A21d2]|nr:helix-turn-helix domain-containing protein [Rhodococcus fascians A21d2]
MTAADREPSKVSRGGARNDRIAATLIKTSDRASSEERSHELYMVYGTACHVPEQRGMTRMTARIVDGDSIAAICCGPGEITRRQVDLEADPRFSVRIQYVLSGEVILFQNGVKMSLKSGEIGLYYSDRSYTVTVTRPSSLVVVTLRQMMDTRERRNVDPASGKKPCIVPSAEGVGKILADTLNSTSNEIERLNSLTARNVISAVRLLAWEEMHRVQSSPDQRPDLLGTVRLMVEKSLSDPTLNPDFLARRLHVSVRQLHRTFEREERTLSAYIAYERIERCAADLMNPSLNQMTIGEIGARWGINDRPRLSRLFRELKGCSPSEFRRFHA